VAQSWPAAEESVPVKRWTTAVYAALAQPMFDPAGGYHRTIRTAARQAIVARYAKIVAEALRPVPEPDKRIIHPAQGDAP
jgi:hypothetical protein